MNHPRRTFLKKSSASLVGLSVVGLSGTLYSCSGKSKNEGGTSEDTTAVTSESIDTSASMFFSISLAQWSLHRGLFDGKIDNLDFAKIAKQDFGIDGIEYVNQFFKDKAKDNDYLSQMKQRADDNGVRSVLIMIDGEGGLAELDDAERNKTVENHYKWVEAAKFLGCHSIRVNARTSKDATMDEAKAAAVEGLGKLVEFGAQHDINIIVENHGGYSSNGIWLTDIMKQVDSPYCGTLPDFGNFCIQGSANPASENGCEKEYDRYKGVKELMPYAKGVSAKTYSFDEKGNEQTIDYAKMLKIVKDAGYTGRIGIEYEGQDAEENGIAATKSLLTRLGKQIS